MEGGKGGGVRFFPDLTLTWQSNCVNAFAFSSKSTKHSGTIQTYTRPSI